jgi:hypothetical protein
MATPTQRSILTQLATNLAAITVANGYKTTVATVELTFKDWESAAVDTVFPCIGIAQGPTRYAYHYGRMRCTLPVNLSVHVDAADASARYDALENLTDDIIKAIYDDHDLSGNAIDVKLITTHPDSGDPDTMDSRGGNGSMAVLLEVIYERELTGS